MVLDQPCAGVDGHPPLEPTCASQRPSSIAGETVAQFNAVKVVVVPAFLRRRERSQDIDRRFFINWLENRSAVLCSHSVVM